MHKSCVVWITGLPGAGKTTLAKALVATLRETRDDVLHLDGDTLRDVLTNYDYSEQGRINIAKQYAKLAQLLAQQDKIVVVSTVSLFHEIHAWNRQHLPHYIEVFVNTSDDTLVARNQKNLYQSEHTDKQNIVGQGIQAQFPLNPDFCFDDNELSDLDNCVERILSNHFLILEANVHDNKH